MVQHSPPLAYACPLPRDHPAVLHRRFLGSQQQRKQTRSQRLKYSSASLLHTPLDLHSPTSPRPPTPRRDPSTTPPQVPWIAPTEDADTVSEMDLYQRIATHRHGGVETNSSGLSAELGHLINSLLHPKHEHRLGCGAGGPEELTAHCWFASVDLQVCNPFPRVTRQPNGRAPH
jgi:hypothetical protein